MTHIKQIGDRALIRPSRSRDTAELERADPAADEALAELYARMSSAKQREFWQLRGSGLNKATFLLRWGSYGRFAEGERTA